jgi:hypothetical protein
VLVHNKCKYKGIKQPEKPTDMDDVPSAGKPGSKEWNTAKKEISDGQGKGKPGINYKVETENEAQQLINEARPDLQNQSKPGTPYANPAPKSGFEIHPATEAVHGNTPHIKWYDWTSNKGDGHIFFNTGGK